MSEEPKAAKAAADKDKSNKAPLDDAPTQAPELVAPGESKPQAPVSAESSQQLTAGAAEQTKQAADVGGIVLRRSPWYSSMAALRYISSLSKDDDVRVRDSDRATSIFLLISSILTVLSLLFPPLAPHRLALVLICDFLVGVMLLAYVANRFGIINTLSPRQALLAWQLMMGAGFLGIFITINLAVAIALIVAQFTLGP